jgi:hypothetical protein
MYFVFVHQNPKLFEGFAKSKLGEVRYGILEKEAMRVKKWSVTGLEILLKGLKEI